MNSPLNDSGEGRSSFFDQNKSPRMRPSATTNGNAGTKPHTSPGMLQSPRGSAFDKSQLSPSLSLRDRNSSDTANTQFPLNDIDYESDPNAIAQELNNLQALRRMSMDVGNTSDPDLPSFQGVSLMPSVAPTGDDNEDDPSRLYWVPARVHPELAPMEFKTFLENRVQSIKRRSGDQTSLSPDSVERSDSGGGLRRKKSMLSRQINNDGGRGAVGYKDGAEQLERKKSMSASVTPDLKISDLAELDALVKDPSKALRKISLDNGKRYAAGEFSNDEDMDLPILPQAPGGPGIGLRRSTRTTYRRGSLRKGDRLPFSKRSGSLRGAETDGEESPASSPVDGRPPIGYPLIKVSSEPTTTENFSRPSRGGRRQQIAQRKNTQDQESLSNDLGGQKENALRSSAEESRATPAHPGSLPRSNSLPRNDPIVPLIVETPPPAEEVPEAPSPKPYQFPERSSSQAPPPIQQPDVFHAPAPEPPARSSKRPNLDRQNSLGPQSITTITSPASTNTKTLNEMAQQPSPLLGNNTRTDTLTFIPTMEEESKPEKKSRKDKDESESGFKKGSWGWFKGSDEKDKKGKKKLEKLEKEDDHKEGKKGRGKLSVDKSHDNARLDVLQSTVDSVAVRGRESLVLDRDREVLDAKLQDERKKESSRKSGGENKKEKDGLFSSFFGGGKKKADRDSGGKKGSSLRTLSPDPPHRELKPDIDYNWTRFSILEERAIYRMAHIKLANPRRALYSQVLLSNFMYSYLAKVQQMHPQMQIPQSAQQKKQEAERKQKEQEQQQRDEQHQQQEEQYRYDYHQVSS